MKFLATLCLAIASPFSQTTQANAPLPSPKNWTNEQDHQNMMNQLDISQLRPGKNGWAKAGEENAANYDPARANPFPDLPQLLHANDGTHIKSAEAWKTLRRPEIIAAFESEVYGRLPPTTPSVSWQVETTYPNITIGGAPATAQKLVGIADNATYPQIDVKIDATLVLPQDSTLPVPILIMFGWKPLELPIDANSAFPLDGMPSRFNEDPPSFSQLIAAGWGFVHLIPTSYQADNGAGLTRGIIGLSNHGQARHPEEWGTLRAWAWGASRCLDYLETRPEVNARQVGIEGVSRYGKAALVTLAFDERFAVGLIGSSGAGGASLHRRDFGESTENLASSAEYHWMAGNYLKYAAATSSLGEMTPDDLPVDSHHLIALCAPRPTFISYGIPENGDALWLDPHGSYMTTVAAGPAFRLLGAKDTGIKEDYRTAPMPPVNHDLLDGELAWRQHDGGHESQSNMKHFLRWADRMLQR